MAYGGEQLLFSIDDTDDENLIHYLDNETSCDLHYYVRRPIDRNGRKIYVVQNILEGKKETFISKHRIVNRRIKIQTIIPKIFSILLEYVYKSLDNINYQQLSPDEIDKILQAARFYEVECLVNKIINYLNKEQVQEIQPKSLFWLIDHYFMNRTNDSSLEDDLISCIQNLSSQTMTDDELNQAESLKYLDKESIDNLLRSRQFTWNAEQKFQLLHAWTRRQLDVLGVPFNSHNISLFLGHTIDIIEIESMECHSFIRTVYNSGFFTRDRCLEFLSLIMGSRRGTINVDNQPQPITGHFKRFNRTDILSGKRYGRRQHRPIQRRRRRRRPNRSTERGEHRNQQNLAHQQEGERRLAAGRDMAELRMRESDNVAQPDEGFPPPASMQTIEITERDDHADTLSFMCSHDALLQQIEVFGSDGSRRGHYQIELKIFEEGNTRNPSFVCSYGLNTDGVTKYYPLTINPPVNITKNKVYTIYTVMIGPSSYFGINGNFEVAPNDAGNMVVLFIPYEIGLNGTNHSRGQFFSITLEKIRALPCRN